MLIDIVNTWNELLTFGIIAYMIAITFVLLTFALTKYKRTILGAISALIAMSLGSISKIVIKISIILALVRLILNFI